MPATDSLDSGVGLPGTTAVAAVKLDWMRFLIDTEMATTGRIVRLLKEEIGCKMPVTDTQVYEACQSIAAGPTFQVLSGGGATLRAGDLVTLEEGLVVESGAELTIEIDPLLAL